MNEAIDLAKYFSNAEAGRFVNGVLDKMRENIEKTKA
jgi:transcription termination factor NusB